MAQANKILKISDMFLKAAEVISRSKDKNGNHLACCFAIDWIDSSIATKNKTHVLFRKYFKPSRYVNDDYWFGEPRGYSFDKQFIASMKFRAEQRILAMLFMHEIAKDLEAEGLL